MYVAPADSDILEESRHHCLALRGLIVLAKLLALEGLARFLIKSTPLASAGD